MLAIGRALMPKPCLLLLDEPSLGLSPVMTQHIFALLKDINAHGTAMLIAEQNAALALSVAQRGYVLETGRVVRSDKASTLLADDGVRRAYLGL